MTFKFSLIRPAEPVEPDSVEPLEDEDDFEYLAMYASKALELAGYRFEIGGFGDPDWKFDVSYDMSTLVEQLPDLIGALRSDTPAVIDFYSQGVERSLTFSPAGDQVRIECESRTSWKPSPAVEVMERSSLEAMIRDFCVTFASSLVVAAPQVAESSPFARWREGEI